MGVTSVNVLGVMPGGGGAMVRPQSIRSTGDLPKVNGGAETLMKWFRLKIICRWFISTGMRRMLSAAGRDVACQPRLNGRWRRVQNRLQRIAESQHTSDSFRGAMKHRHHTERIWIGRLWVASMSDC